MKVTAILPSGGEGKRFGNALPKQYQQVRGKEILAYTIELFQNCSLIDKIVIAADPYYFDLIADIKEKYGFRKITKVVHGGKERQDSVFNALSSLSCDDDDLIAVHDAVRPLLPNTILDNAIIMAKNFDNVVVAIKARDTLIESSDNENLFVQSYYDREKIYYAQTPQIFSYAVLMDSMKKAANDEFWGTDESMLVKRAGYAVKIIEGSSLNFKITTPVDLDLFEKLTFFSS